MPDQSYRACPAGKYGQYFAALIATLSLFVTAEFYGWPSGVLPKIDDGTAGFTLTDLEKSILVSLPNVGAIISPIPSGYIMDRIGRKTTLTYCIVMVVVSWLVLSLSNSIWPIFCCRFVLGLWNGVEFTIVAIYIAEVVDPDIRASLISMMILTFNMGVLYISFISFASYQTMTLLCVIPPIILFLGFLFIPESPYFYLMRGKREEAEASILWLRSECHSEDLDKIETAVKDQLMKQGSFKEIFSASNRKGFFTVECFKVCMATSATTLLIPYTTEVIPHGWISPRESYVVLSTIWVLSSLFSSALMYRFTRRSIMMVSTIGAMILLCFTAGWYYLRDFSSFDTSTTPWFPLRLLCGAVFFESIGINYIANVLKGELFPVNIKAKACALSCMTASVFQVINFLLFYPINTHIGMWFNFLKSAISAAFCLCIVIFFMTETKGQTLEDIQDILNSANPPESSREQPEQTLLVQNQLLQSQCCTQELPCMEKDTTC